MRATQRIARAGVLWLVLSLAAAVPPAWAAETANDVARFLAGLAPAADSPLAPLSREAAWQQHARSLDAAWSNLEQSRLSRIRAWSATYLTKPQPVVLYMFSGPDFLYVDAFFSERSTYVLAGLEPIGQVPTVTPALGRSLAPALGGLRASVGSALNYSFFITQRMKADFAGSKLNGVLPVLYMFLARSGK